MKIAPSILRLAPLSLLAFVQLDAQTTVSQVVIFKGTEFVQTSAAGAVVNPLGQGPSYGGPYNFRVSVQGTNISALTPTPQVTLADGSLFPTENPTMHNNGFLAYDSNDDEWKYGLNHNNYGGQSESGRDASFAFGTYGMDVQGVSFTMNFPQQDSLHPDIAPVVTLSGGSWVAGRYVIDASHDLTITTNAFPNFTRNADAAMELQLENQVDLFGFYSDNTSAPNFQTYTIPGGTLTADRDYRGNAGFHSIMDKPTVAGLPGSLTGTVYSMSTRFVVSTIATPTPNAAATLYRVGHLSDLSDAQNNYSEVRDVTKVGGVIYAVGNSIAYTGSLSSDTGFLWTSTNGLTALPNVVDTFTTNPTFVTASAITPDGAYIAGRTRAGTGGNERHANRVTVSGLSNLDLGTLPGYTVNAAALSISADGSVMYGFSKYGTTGKTQAVRITVSGPTVTAIPFLNPGDDQSGPGLRSISSDGTIMIGTSVNSGTAAGNADHVGNQAFRYVDGTGVSAIPFLTGGTWSGALALSADGNLALISGNSTAYTGGEVYLRNFTAATSTSLGAPAGYNTPSNIGGMNSDGSLVVLSWGNSPNGCFLHNTSGWHSLTTIMTNAGVNLSNWTIDNIFGMSPDGTLIWGAGTHNGQSEGWVAEFNAGYLAGYGMGKDFNGDGKVDVVWQNITSGDRYLWLMNGTAFSSGVDLGIVPTDWQIAGAGDFNGDGKTDILWENTATGDRYLWLMNGTAFSSGVALGNVATAWKIVGAADFNGDSKTDILWENSVTGQRVIWFMNGTGLLSTTSLGTVSSDYHIVGAADLNGDGKADILFENTVTGDRYIWLMNGAAYSSGVDLGVVSTDWHIAALGDYNGDGQPDIFWENTATGDRYLWLMNGTNYSSGIDLGVTSTDWHVAP